MQVAAITALRSLELCGNGCPLASASCEPIQLLTNLTALCLRHFSNLPRPLLGALPALQQLQSLQLIKLREDGESLFWDFSMNILCMCVHKGV